MFGSTPSTTFGFWNERQSAKSETRSA